MGKSGGAFFTGALLAGGGLVGFLGGRWLLVRVLDRVDGPVSRAPNPAAAAPAAPATGARVAPSSTSVVAAPLGPPPADLDPERFDWLFEAHRGSIPIEYLRALAICESGLRAGEQTGPAWGLLQIVEVVRRDYNRAHGTSHQRADLLDPAVNVAIATWLLHQITESYKRNHPEVPNLQEDWTNPRFVELLTFGWNAGWSEAGGVGRVARHLEARGIRDLTIDLVHSHARAAGASRHLSRADKVAWCKKVVATYQRERARAAGPAARKA